MNHILQGGDYKSLLRENSLFLLLQINSLIVSWFTSRHTEHTWSWLCSTAQCLRRKNVRQKAKTLIIVYGCVPGPRWKKRGREDPEKDVKKKKELKHHLCSVASNRKHLLDNIFHFVSHHKPTSEDFRSAKIQYTKCIYNGSGGGRARSWIPFWTEIISK